jgi:hypothetical protein
VVGGGTVLGVGAMPGVRGLLLVVPGVLPGIPGVDGLVLSGRVPGVAGVVGVVGEVGDVGLAGELGLSGLVGKVGLVGLVVAPGLAGAPGVDGVPGVVGVRGVVWVPGDVGLDWVCVVCAAAKVAQTQRTKMAGSRLGFMVPPTPLSDAWTEGAEEGSFSCGEAMSSSRARAGRGSRDPTPPPPPCFA